MFLLQGAELSITDVQERYYSGREEGAGRSSATRGKVWLSSEVVTVSIWYLMIWIWWSEDLLEVTQHDLFLISWSDSSCLSDWWDSAITTDTSRWDACWHELLPWNHLERSSQVFASSGHGVKGDWCEWASSTQHQPHPILFLDGGWSWWYLPWPQLRC